MEKGESVERAVGRGHGEPLLDAGSVVLMAARKGSNLLSSVHGRHANGAVDGQGSLENGGFESLEGVLGNLLLLHSLVEQEQQFVVLRGQLAVLEVEQALSGDAAGSVAVALRTAKCLLQIALLLGLSAVTLARLPVDRGRASVLLGHAVVELVGANALELSDEAVSYALVGALVALAVVLRSAKRHPRTTNVLALVLVRLEHGALDHNIVVVEIALFLVPLVLLVQTIIRIVVLLLLLNLRGGRGLDDGNERDSGLRGVHMSVGGIGSPHGGLLVRGGRSSARNRLRDGEADRNFGHCLHCLFDEECSEDGKRARSHERVGRAAKRLSGLISSNSREKVVDGHGSSHILSGRGRESEQVGDES